MTSSPKVSVCIPALNYGRFLRECLTSVFAQTLPEFEVILVDNASVDETAEVAREFSDPRLRYYRNETTVPPADNHNRAFELASAPYIALLHADDVLLPQRLEKGYNALEREPSAKILYSACWLTDAEGRRTGVFPAVSENCIASGSEEFLRLARGHYFPASTVLFRRELLSILGGFEARVGGACDMLFYMRSALLGDVAFLAEPLAEYRQHGGNDSTLARASGRMADDLLMMYDLAFAELPSGAVDLARHRDATIGAVYAWGLHFFIDPILEALTTSGLADATGMWARFVAEHPRTPALTAHIPHQLVEACVARTVREAGIDSYAGWQRVRVSLDRVFQAGGARLFAVPSLRRKVMAAYHLRVLREGAARSQGVSAVRHLILALWNDPRRRQVRLALRAFRRRGSGGTGRL